MLEKQAQSYNVKQANLGVMIGVIALFVTLFIQGLASAPLLIQALAIIPIVLFAIALTIMLYLLISKPLQRGVSSSKYQELANKPYEDIIIFEIGVNTDSFKANKPIIDFRNVVYNISIVLAILSIITSVLMLVLANIYTSIHHIKLFH